MIYYIPDWVCFIQFSQLVMHNDRYNLSFFQSGCSRYVISSKDIICNVVIEIVMNHKYN